MQGVLRWGLSEWKRKHNHSLFLKWAERHLHTTWGVARQALTLSVWFRAKRRSDAMVQAEAAAAAALLQRALHTWRRRLCLRFVQRRVRCRNRRRVLAGWRREKDRSLCSCLVAIGQKQKLELKQSALVWRQWLHFCDQRAWGRRREGIARACQLRALRMLLLGVWSKWKSLAAGLSIVERMQGLTLAMGTYEKALKEAETHVHFPRKVTLSPFHSLKGGPTVIGGPLTLVVFCSEALWKMTIHLCGRCSMRRSPNSQSCKPSINRAYPHS